MIVLPCPGIRATAFSSQGADPAGAGLLEYAPMQLPCYRIRNWDTVFENSESRKRAELRWVPIPNEFDGDGFTTLIGMKNGATYYGIWVLLVAIASKSEPRGTLIRKNSMPHDPKSLSRITGADARTIAKAIDVLISDEIGWLEVANSPRNTHVARDERPTPSAATGTNVPRGSHETPTPMKEGIEGKKVLEDKPRAGAGGNDLTRLWDQLYEAKHGGGKYPWSKKDAIAIAAVAKTLGSPEALERAIRRYLADTDPFFTGHPIGKFQSQLARFTDAAAKGGKSGALSFDDAWAKGVEDARRIDAEIASAK